MLQRLKVDDIVHPDDRVKAREYECPICMGIPPTSSVVLTACCQNITCTECIAPLEACPNCRMGFEGDGTKTVPLPPIVHRILHNIKVVCPFSHTARDATGPDNSSSSNDTQAIGGGGICTANSRRGGDSSEHAGSCCDWTGNYGDLLIKHIAECAYAEIDCPHGCGERFLRGQLSTHGEGCEKGYEECGICGVMVKIGGMTGHRAEAAETHVKILEGERADLRAQVAERHAVLAKVDGVKADVDTIAANMGTMKQDLIGLIAPLGIGRAVWKLKTSDLFEKCSAKGVTMRSPKISLGLGFKFVLHFDAMGDASSVDGKAALFVEQNLHTLCLPGSAIVEVSAVDNEFEKVSCNISWQSICDSVLPYGSSNFMSISNLRKAAEVHVTLRCTNADNGRIIEVGGRDEQPGGIDVALTRGQAELKDALEETKVELKEAVAHQTALAERRLTAAIAAERVRTEELKDVVMAALAAATIVCLAIVVIRK